MYARAREDLAEYQAGEIVKIADNQELERRQSEVRGKRPPRPPMQCGPGPLHRGMGAVPHLHGNTKIPAKKITEKITALGLMQTESFDQQIIELIG